MEVIGTTNADGAAADDQGFCFVIHGYASNIKIDMAAKRRKRHKNQISGLVNSMFLLVSGFRFQGQKRRV